VGSSISADSTAFKKIQKFSKLSSNNISSEMSCNNASFQKIHNLYLSPDSLNNNTFNYGTKRQHNFSSSNSMLSSFSSLVDKTSFDKFFMYSLNSTPIKGSFLDRFIPFKTAYNNNDEVNYNVSDYNLLNAKYILNSASFTNANNNLFFNKWLAQYYDHANRNNTTDGKNDANPLISLNKVLLAKKNNIKTSLIDGTADELTNNTKNSFYS
jgi:hypothetical protein